MKCILVTTNDKYKVVDTNNLQDLVGGHVEIVRPTSGYTDRLLLKNNVFLCDEEGHCKEKPNNYFGTLLYNGLYGPKSIYPIAGDIVIVGESEEDFRDLTDEEIEYYTSILKILRIRELS